MALDTQQTITSKAVASEPQHAAAADVIARMSSAAMYSGLSTVPTDASSSMVLRSSSSEETEIVVYPCPYCQRTFISLGYLHKCVVGAVAASSVSSSSCVCVCVRACVFADTATGGIR